MAESFTNVSTRKIGVTTSVNTATVGAAGFAITNCSTFNVSPGMLVDHSNFVKGTRVTVINTASNFGTSGEITVDTVSTNTETLENATIGFHTVSSVYTASEKTILVGGTLANNTNSQIEATVMLNQSGNDNINIIASAPIPAGSSLVISDAGKLVVGIGCTISVSTYSDNAVDSSFSFLKGVS